MKFQVSDWVQGNTESGELIQGFVVASYEGGAVAKVHVVKSDNEDAVGRVIPMREARLREIPAAGESMGQLKDLIDLALTVRDEAWFLELSARLNQGPRQEGHPTSQSIPDTASYNRLGSQGLK
ncbi:hypothetical protein FHS18_000697 [Paenibacillus phyllosphaerae]|uniref:IDEAL domain-containing protein n=1 Tax=Paenibacillus phyllosphaerae TaxID=274593 RepID=A0A7W5AU95_9BACL|nr:IDEAL domain-containing protein [Paenibacillus phyllosphaerae]MBB3108669.1 hypothetical protein [Paenibacillus phyllosphaerae]